LPALLPGELFSSGLEFLRFSPCAAVDVFVINTSLKKKGKPDFSLP